MIGARGSLRRRGRGRGRGRRRRRRRCPGARLLVRVPEDGLATVVLPMLLWVATLVAIVAIDVGAYLVAGARAQQLADAGALAAVSVDVPRSPDTSPREAAVQVVTAGGGHLESCDCGAGRAAARVEASVPVPGLVLPRIGARRVAASASAVLVPAPSAPSAPTAPPAPPAPSAPSAPGWVQP